MTPLQSLAKGSKRAHATQQTSPSKYMAVAQPVCQSATNFLQLLYLSVGVKLFHFIYILHGTLSEPLPLFQGNWHSCRASYYTMALFQNLFFTWDSRQSFSECYQLGFNRIPSGPTNNNAWFIIGCSNRTL